LLALQLSIFILQGTNFWGRVVIFTLCNVSTAGQWRVQCSLEKTKWCQAQMTAVSRCGIFATCGHHSLQSDPTRQ